MSADTRPTYPATTSNQITPGYYRTIIEMQHAGTTQLRVQRVTRRNGRHTYETYHIITSP